MDRPFRLSKKYDFTGPCYRARPGKPLVFIDLGKRKVGWAVFIDGRLAHCGTVVMNPGFRWDPSIMALLVVDTVRKATDIQSPRNLDWVCEWPVVLQQFRVAKQDVEDLQTVGREMGTAIGGWKEKYKPAEWKGTIPKSVHHGRIALLLDALEYSKLPYLGAHDTWDAVGGGLFAIGRCGRGGLR